MRGPSPSPLVLASCGFSSSPMRATAAKASKSHMSPMMVRQFSSLKWIGSNVKNRLILWSLLHLKIVVTVYYFDVAFYTTVYTQSIVCPPSFESCCVPEDYQQLIEDIVRDGRLYASENHQEILKVLNDYQHDLKESHFILPHDWSSDTFVPPTGQEADKGAVWCTGPSPELLQVYCTGVQRDVPSLLHQAAALQSHQVSTAIQIGRGLLTVWSKSPMILYHSKSSSQNTSLPICSFLSLHQFIDLHVMTDYPDFFSLSHDAFPHLWPLLNRGYSLRSK